MLGAPTGDLTHPPAAKRRCRVAAGFSAPWKGAGLQWESLRTKPTRQLSLQPVAAEAGKPEALGVKGPFSGSASEQAVMRMNTEQVPKPGDVDADPAETWGKLPLERKRAKRALFKSTGALVTACWQEEPCGNTGSPMRRETLASSNPLSVRAGRGCMGWRRGPYYRRNRVMPVEGRGLGSGSAQEEAKARRLT